MVPLDSSSKGHPSAHQPMARRQVAAAAQAARRFACRAPMMNFDPLPRANQTSDCNATGLDRFEIARRCDCIR
jgi:hypothetical protein